jgi:hypothetical protein
MGLLEHLARIKRLQGDQNDSWHSLSLPIFPEGLLEIFAMLVVFALAGMERSDFLQKLSSQENKLLQAVMGLREALKAKGEEHFPNHLWTQLGLKFPLSMSSQEIIERVEILISSIGLEDWLIDQAVELLKDDQLQIEEALFILQAMALINKRAQEQKEDLHALEEISTLRTRGLLPQDIWFAAVTMHNTGKSVTIMALNFAQTYSYISMKDLPWVAKAIQIVLEGGATQEEAREQLGVFFEATIAPRSVYSFLIVAKSMKELGITQELLSHEFLEAIQDPLIGLEKLRHLKEEGVLPQHLGVVALIERDFGLIGKETARQVLTTGASPEEIIPIILSEYGGYTEVLRKFLEQGFPEEYILSAFRAIQEHGIQGAQMAFDVLQESRDILLVRPHIPRHGKIPFPVRVNLFFRRQNDKAFFDVYFLGLDLIIQLRHL